MFFQGRKQDGKLQFIDYNATQLKLFLEDYKEGTWFNVKITKAQKPKSEGQLGLYYGVYLLIVNRELIRKGFTMTVCDRVKIPINKKQTDKVIKYFCARKDEDGNIVLHDADNFPDRPIVDKSNMGSDHMKQFLSNVKAWATEYLGCFIPEANRN